MELPPKPEVIADVTDSLWLKALNHAAKDFFNGEIDDSYYTYSNHTRRLWEENARLSIMTNEIKENTVESLANDYYNEYVRWIENNPSYTAREAFVLIFSTMIFADLRQKLVDGLTE
jgi:hypothetical protein